MEHHSRRQLDDARGCPSHRSGEAGRSSDVRCNNNGCVIKDPMKAATQTLGRCAEGTSVPDDAIFAKPYVPPEVWKKAPPEDVIAELEKIPDLTATDWTKAFNMLSYDDFQFRSLKALPMEFKKKWLLNEIK